MNLEPLSSAPSVCVVLLSGLGDVVHGLPVVNALRDDDAERRITWVVEPMPADLLRPHPSIDEVIVFEKRRGWRGVRELWRALGGRRFDLALNFNIYFKSIFPTVLSRSPIRLGFDRGRARDGVWAFCNRHLPPGPRRHTQDMFLEFAGRLGLPVTRPEWRIPVTPAERVAQADFFGGLDGRPVVTIVPASGKRPKDWVAGRWAVLADALASDFGFRVVLAGGPSARERTLAETIVARAAPPPIVALGDGVRRLTWLIEGSRLLIAPDTGPVHIARALEVPVIGLYGHTNPWRVGPYRKFEDLWIDRYTDEGEAPDPSRFDPKSGRMERITVDDVLGRVELAVQRYGVTRAAARSGS